MTELKRIDALEKGFIELKRGLIDLITMVRVLESDFTDLRLELVQSTAIPRPETAPVLLSGLVEPEPAEPETADLAKPDARGMVGAAALAEWRKHRVPSTSPAALYNRDLRRRKQEAAARGEPFERIKRRWKAAPEGVPKPAPSNTHWRGGLPPIVPALQQIQEEAEREAAFEAGKAAALSEAVEAVETALPEPTVTETPMTAVTPTTKRTYGWRDKVPDELLTGPIALERPDVKTASREEWQTYQRQLKAIHNARYNAKKKRQAATMREAAPEAEAERPFPQGDRRKMGMKPYMTTRHQKLVRENERAAEVTEQVKPRLVRETLAQWADRRRARMATAKGHHKHRHHHKQPELT